MIDRSTFAHRFIPEENAAGSSLFGIPYRKAPEVSRVLIGNPFMSHLNFLELWSENSNLIEKEYAIYNGESMQVFAWLADGTEVSNVEADDSGNRFVRPMQGFFVTPVNNASGNLLIRATNMTTVRDRAGIEAPFLRSSKPSVYEIVKITADNGESRSTATVVRHTEDVAKGEGVDKMFGGRMDIPEVYLFRNKVLKAIAEIGKEEQSIDFGVKSMNEGQTVTLHFALPDEPDTQMFLYDKLTDKTSELTPDNNTYTYRASVGKNEIESRFTLSFENKTGISSFAPNHLQIYMDKRVLEVVSSSDPIEWVTIYNTQGQIQERYEVGQTELRISLPYASGVYMVQVRTHGEVVVKKVIIK